VLALLAATAGCAASGSPGGHVSSTVTIALVPGINDAPIYLAEHDGLFAKAGLANVVIKSYSTEGQVISALQGSHADIAALDYGDIFYQQANQRDLSILADGYDAGTGVLEVLTLPNSKKITSPTKLGDPGVTVGFPNYDVLPKMLGTGHPASLEAAAVTEVLTSYLGNAALSVNWAAMSEQAEVNALLSGRVQAIVVGEPYIYEAESHKGAVELMDGASGPTANLPLSGYVSTSAWAKDNPAAAADFQSALAKAQSDAALFGPVQQLLPHVVSDVTTEDADLATVGTYPTTTSLVDLDRDELLMSNENMITVGASGTWSGKIGPMIVHN
jgi:NitT/TauT family transport system substrate-binding protein